MSAPEQLQLAVWRTRELRELLEDEEKIKCIVKCSGKLQQLQQAAEKMLLSNQKLAKTNLSQKPKLRDTKLLLSVRYKELGKLQSIIQAKQEQLVEKHAVRYAQWSLMEKVNQSDEEFELLFHKFSEGNVALPDFLDSSLGARRLYHIRSVLLKKLPEMITEHTLSQVQFLSVGFPEHIQPLCSLTTAIVLPACYQPPFLLPLGAHRLQLSAVCSNGDDDDEEPLRAGRQGVRWPVRPVRLQPLKVQQRRKQQH